MKAKQLKELLNGIDDDIDVVFGLFVSTDYGWDHVPINIAGVDNELFSEAATIRLVPHAVDGEGYTRVCDKDDYETAYEYFRTNTVKETAIMYGIEEFLKEIKKGYGNSSCIEIARLINQYDGIWYDEGYQRYAELSKM